jgi:hypothetical protein
VNVLGPLLVPEQEKHHGTTAHSMSAKHMTSVEANRSKCTIPVSVLGSTTAQHPKSFIQVRFLPLHVSVTFKGMRTFASMCKAQQRPREELIIFGALTLKHTHLELLGLMVMA